MTKLSFALIALLCASPAFAGSVSVAVSDTDGKPVTNAIVELAADTPVALPASRIPAEAIIDQRHEMFIPLVSVVRKGGRVVFTNNDTTMHQVYSFSPIKQFEFEIDQGQRSQPLVFDKPGVASIGCNIHDQMITYVYVADSPFTAATDSKGIVRFADVPDGAYHAKVWHPQLAPGKAVPSQPVSIAQAPASVTVTVSLLAMSGMKHMHMGSY